MVYSLFFFLFWAVHSAFAVDPIVNLSYSSYQGSAFSNGVSQWLGMRYAAPPLGNLRFAEPQDPLQNDTLQIANQVRARHSPFIFSSPADRHYSTASYVWPLQETLMQRIRQRLRSACFSMSMHQLVPPPTPNFLCTSSFKVVALTPIPIQTTMAVD